jgi:pyridoxamine 5'-phosphate oxidase
MHEDLGNYRKTYKKEQLLESGVPENPIELFQRWFYEIEASGSTDEPNAMNVATNGLDGFPKNRMVLLKGFTAEGFVFFTNYQSEKGKAISADPRVCLSFYWGYLERQVIIKGMAEKLPENLSDGYFESRPDGSKLTFLLGRAPGAATIN